jgi:hypothetical protein
MSLPLLLCACSNIARMDLIHVGLSTSGWKGIWEQLRSTQDTIRTITLFYINIDNRGVDFRA